MSYMPGTAVWRNLTARTAPLAKQSRLEALWVSSTRSPSAAKMTVWSPTTSDASMPRVGGGVESGGGGEDFADALGGAGGGVLLAVVVHLDDFHVVVGAKGAGDLVAEGEEEIDNDAHIGGADDAGAVVGEALEGGLVLGCEAGGADDESESGGGGLWGQGHGDGGEGEVDDGVGVGERGLRVGGDGDAAGLESGDGARVLSEEGRGFRLQCATKFEVGVSHHMGNQHPAHAASGSNNHSSDHLVRNSCLFVLSGSRLGRPGSVSCTYSCSGSSADGSPSWSPSPSPPGFCAWFCSAFLRSACVRSRSAWMRSGCAASSMPLR